MDNNLEKFVVWLRGEFILFFRQIEAAFKKNEKLAASVDDLRAELAKERKINVTHEVNIPDIKVPAPQVTVNVPEIKLPVFKIPDIVVPKVQMPEINIPEIKIPPIKLPTINVPKPEVTVNVEDREDKAVAKLLTQVLKKLDSLKAYELWNDIGAKTPVPVILVDENAKYYKAGQAASGVAVVSGGGGSAARPLNNVIFGSGSISVSTPGEPVQLPNIPCAEVTLTAFENNAKNVYVGGANVSAEIGSQNGAPLSPLGTISVKIDNLSKIFVDVQEGGDGLTYAYVS